MTNRVEAFVRASEIWVPDGGKMRLHSGAYAGHTEFARVSARKTFQKGEGLPGSVWQGGRAEVWEELGPLFVRRELAEAAGINAAVGMPIFRGDAIIAVVVLLCGQHDETEGSIEVWDVDHEQRCLSYAAGYYDNLEGFARISRLLQFQSGSGIPGVAWQLGAPLIVEDLRSSSSFTRVPLLEGSGLTAALAVPVRRSGEIEQVVLFLSSQTTPIARAFEIWAPGERGLMLEQAVYASGLEALAEWSRSARLARGEGLPGAVWETGMPQVFDRLESGGAGHDAAARAGLETGLAIPMHDDVGLVSVVVLLS